MICKYSKIIDQIIRRENTALSFCSYHVPEILVWGQKRRHTPSPPHYISAFVQPISWLTSWAHDWLIDCYRRVGVRDPDRSHTQTPSIFTSLRITDVKSVLLFLLPTGWVGRQFFFYSAWIRRFPGFTGCCVPHSAVFTCRLCSTN